MQADRRHSPNFGIIGAGNGGQTLAADLALRGFAVAGIYDRYPEAIEPLQRRGGIELIGRLNGFARIPLATTDLGEVIRQSDVLFIVVPAFAHSYIAESCAEHLRDGQMLVIMPGYLGTFIFRNVIGHKRPGLRVMVGETMSLPYAVRLVGPAVAGVKGVKGWLKIAALPSSDTAELMRVLHGTLPLEAAESVLETSLNNPNPMGHVPTMLLNWGQFEAGKVTTDFDYHEWITPSIARLIETIDGERIEALRRLGVPVISHREFGERSYGTQRPAAVPQQGEIRASSRATPDRYVTEDVPMGLVPLAAFASAIGVTTPHIDLMIDLASALMRVDYRSIGRTPAQLGLDVGNWSRVREIVTMG